MWKYPKSYGVIVIGAGHAGCEAALAPSRRGVQTLLITMNLDTIGKMSCNPAIGGIGKGHLVRELDALGGQMALLADQCAIQYRMLNRKKGPAVWAPRAQIDRFAYQAAMKSVVENTQNLDLFQASIEHLEFAEGRFLVQTKEGLCFEGLKVIVCSGTFMQGKIHLGDQETIGGRAGDPPSIGLSASLKQLGFTLDRLKTGTPPRIHKDSIDFTKLEEQPSEEGICFSFQKPSSTLPKISCHIAYTNQKTQDLALENLKRSAMYSGKIESIGPRYCPSFEDKVVRFADKTRHQLFLEPEGIDTKEVYVNGLSTSLPFDVQIQMLQSIEGFENVHILKPGYAIEYDYVLSGQIDPTMETKAVEGLFFAGQINGTTGYEEAAVQGFIAGINASNQLLNQPPFYPSRSESYIGVLLDDLTTKPLLEPYRMFTSRAEYRLALRQDNAHFRLMSYGYELGLIEKSAYDKMLKTKQTLETEKDRLEKTFVTYENKSLSLAGLLRRPEITFEQLQTLYPDQTPALDLETGAHLSANIKYEGYLVRQQADIEKLNKAKSRLIPKGFVYDSIEGLSHEAIVMLKRFAPTTLDQASRIQGVTPADIHILIIALERGV